MKIGITGGIGSGKSYVCQLLRAHGIEVYDCDQAAKRIICTSDNVRQQLLQLIGSLEKADIARFLLESESNAKQIDAIVHPAVFRDFEESGFQWMESAILYESGAYRLVDRVVVVTAPEEVRIQRVMQRDGISRAASVAPSRAATPCRLRDCQRRPCRPQQSDREIIIDAMSNNEIT